MEAVGQLFDALYTRLVLRDFFGRVLPGSLVLWSLALLFGVSRPAALLGSLSLGQWLLLVAAAWVTAFWVQRLGELELPIVGRMIFYSPPFSAMNVTVDPADLDHTAWRSLATDPLWWYQLVIAFRNATADAKDAEHRLQLERAVVIKEACGNTCVASVLATTLVVFGGAFDRADAGLVSAGVLVEGLRAAVEIAPIGIVTIAVVALLRQVHVEHVWRQYRYARFLLRDRKADLGQYPETRPPYPEWRRLVAALPVFWLGAAIFGHVMGVVAAL